MIEKPFRSRYSDEEDVDYVMKNLFESDHTFEQHFLCDLTDIFDGDDLEYISKSVLKDLYESDCFKQTIKKIAVLIDTHADTVIDGRDYRRTVEHAWRSATGAF